MLNILKVTQQGAAPVQCGCRLGCARWHGIDIGATWRIWL